MAACLRRIGDGREEALELAPARAYPVRMPETIPDSWREVLEPVLATQEARRLGGWLRAEEEAGKIIYPPRGSRLRALELTPREAVRVVVLGQDPYHGPGQAMGLSFSVPQGVKVPPSLANIYKELEADLCISRPVHGDLTRWAEQGVLLLNNTLTVEAGQAGSHAGRGWDAVTDAVVRSVAESAAPTAFVLWGSHAQKKADRIEALRSGDRHLVLRSPHPSPLSAHRGFFGSRPFSKTNAFLESTGRGAVDWAL